MKRFMLTLVVAGSVIMSVSHAEPAQPEVEKVYGKLQKVLKEYGIRRWTQANYNLRVTHKTNKFMVHTVHKTGFISPKPVEVEGPNYDGLIIEARVGIGQYAGSAEIPQDWKRPYWTTFINAYSINEGKSHLSISISYGSRTDKQMIEKIKKCFGPIVDPISLNKATKSKLVKE